MAFQTVFERYELKYFLSEAQKQVICQAMEPYMRLDRYGRTTIRNLYLDTDNYRLARRSIERPVYKEKLRVRSYAQSTADSTVFVELKKEVSVGSLQTATGAYRTGCDAMARRNSALPGRVADCR